jgi:uncharacterized protein YidB (DUF937 family)
VSKPITTEVERQQLQDLSDGVGYSSDKILARYYNTTRKTIWCWTKQGKLPQPRKIGSNTTRWCNQAVKLFEKEAAL